MLHVLCHASDVGRDDKYASLLGLVDHEWAVLQPDARDHNGIDFVKDLGSPTSPTALPVGQPRPRTKPHTHTHTPSPQPRCPRCSTRRTTPKCPSFARAWRQAASEPGSRCQVHTSSTSQAAWGAAAVDCPSVLPKIFKPEQAKKTSEQSRPKSCKNARNSLNGYPITESTELIATNRCLQNK